jgi:hypothetical protein
MKLSPTDVAALRWKSGNAMTRNAISTLFNISVIRRSHGGFTAL